MTSIIDNLDIEKTSAPMILILGETGAGKSHFCNKVLGEDVEEVVESASLKSCKISIVAQSKVPQLMADTSSRYGETRVGARERGWSRVPSRRHAWV